MPEIKFRSYADHNFRDASQSVRAFVYTDYSIEPHNHDFYEMNIVFRGQGMHMIENSHIPVKTGDVFVIPPNTVHAYYDTKNLDVCHVLLRTDFIDKNREEAAKIPGFLQLTEIEPFLRRNFSGRFFLHLSVSRLSQLKSDLSLIEDGAVFDGYGFAAAKSHTAWKMLFWLSVLLFEQLESAQARSDNKYETNIIKALEYIHQHYAEKITVETLCRLVFLSRSTFLRNFSALCGCTPMNYLNKYRSSKALQMIETGLFSKTETAHACGFYDLSHMERVMKAKA